MCRIALTVALPLLLIALPLQAHTDACQAQLPQSLATALERAYPGYRSPLETDNAPDDIAFNRDHGGTGCLGVASGDFTGEGKKDYVVGLTARKGRAGLAVLALPRRGGWNFVNIRSGAEDARFLQFVEVVEPGRYDRPVSAPGALAPGEAASLVCANDGARAGRIGGAATVTCYQAGRWQHVAASD